MKKILTVLALAMLVLPVAARAADPSSVEKTARRTLKYGVTGGVNFTQVQANALVKDRDYGVFKNTTSWNIGFISQASLNNYTTISLAALYTKRQATLVEDESWQVKTGYVEVPVSVQLGIDLILFRPYVDVGIFGGYLVNASPRNDIVSFNDWEFGAKAGAGFQVWKFQLSAHYNWNFIPVLKTDKGIVNYVDLSLAILF